MTEAMKAKRQALAQVSRVIKQKIAEGVIEATTINEGLIELYSEHEDLEFNTFWEWKKKGFSVKKGSTAFLVWGRPRKAKAKEPVTKPDGTEDDEFKFWPVAYLFSEKQVEKTKKEKEVQNEMA